MIVRISGTGQFELRDDQLRELEALDIKLTDAFHKHDDHVFHHVLSEMVTFVRAQGAPLEHGRLEGSDVIMPPEDVTIPEAEKFFKDEGLIHHVAS